MEQTPLLSPPIPWYRTRWFWGVVYILILGYASYLFTASISSASSISILSIKQLTAFAIFSSGAILFFALGALAGKIGSWIFGSLFYLIIAFCIYKTFEKKRVKILYPIILVTLFTLGIVIGKMYASGL